MIHIFVIALATVGWLWTADYTTAQAGPQDNERSRSELILGDSTTYFGPIKPNAYGAGIHSDATGRAFQWQPQGQPKFGPDPTLTVTPNHYGLGVHADQYGGIVKPVCPFGQSIC